MPLKYLTTLQGTNIALPDIDIIKDSDKFGVSPATLQYILDHQQSRCDVGHTEVTASQIGKGIRQMYLEDTIDFAMTPQQLIAGTMGTLKHAVINVGGEDIISEVRFKSLNGHISAKHDNACVVHKENKVIDIYDLKAVGWFKVKMILQNGIWEEGSDYGFQLNLQAALIEENTDYTVDRLFLEFVPRDLDARKRAEAAKMSIKNPGVILYEVSRLSKEAVIARYETVWQARQDAHSIGYAPICPEETRWVNAKSKESRRCLEYCPVLEFCKAMCDANGEVHPTETSNSKVAEKALQYNAGQWGASVEKTLTSV